MGWSNLNVYLHIIALDGTDSKKATGRLKFTSENAPTEKTPPRARRMLLGLRQEDLALRSGVSTPTIKKFERTGEIGTLLLAKIALVLGSLNNIGAIFDARPLPSIAEMEAQERLENKKRVRIKR